MGPAFTAQDRMNLAGVVSPPAGLLSGHIGAAIGPSAPVLCCIEVHGIGLGVTSLAAGCCSQPQFASVGIIAGTSVQPTLRTALLRAERPLGPILYVEKGKIAKSISIYASACPSDELFKAKRSIMGETPVVWPVAAAGAGSGLSGGPFTPAERLISLTRQ